MLSSQVMRKMNPPAEISLVVNLVSRVLLHGLDLPFCLTIRLRVKGSTTTKGYLEMITRMRPIVRGN